MVPLLCAVAMETVCGMLFYTARKSSSPIEEQPQTMKMSRGVKECMHLVVLGILLCPLYL